MTQETLQFQAEVSRLLEIVAKSLYSQKEVFVRELISNASDACDRLRYAALTEPSLTGDTADFKITLTIDKTARTLTVADNGVGMNRDQLIENLGTIARSGTLAFVEQLAGQPKPDLSLIGQFGVGFYSAFMVAETVEVISRHAGDQQGWRWVSDGKGEFSVGEVDAAERGTRVVVHLAADEDEFLDPSRLRRVVATHSDHIAIPVELVGEDGTIERLNRASALWMRPKAEISADDYKEFYHHVAHGFDEPWRTVHWHAEGVIEYTALLFVPSQAPFDLYHPERKNRLRLYVRRVFVSDHVDGLIPPFLRFVSGIVDSEDLPLNVSREMLQNNPLVTKIRQGLTKRILADLTKAAEKDPEGYATFWPQFGAVLKEGLYEAPEHHNALLPLIRLHSVGGAADQDAATLAGYVERMKPGQDAIYYITGDDRAALSQSPQLEGFRAKGIEVLLLTDPIDEFWVPALGQYDDKPFKSVTRGGADLAKITGDGEAADETKPSPGIDALVARLKLALKDDVKDVRPSERLTDSPVCLVADDSDLDLHLERLLKQHKQLDTGAKRILEINPRHPLVARMGEIVGSSGTSASAAAQVEDLAHLLLDQARIVEGDPLPDPAAFSRRLTLALQRGLSATA